MTILGIPLRELVVGLVALFTAIFVAYDKFRQSKLAKDKGLAPNPERCEQHGLGIAKLEVRMGMVEERLRNIEEKLDDL